MKYFKLNQTVYHPVLGEGIVVEIDENEDERYPITVKFGDNYRSFTLEGIYDNNQPITLSQNPIPKIVNTPLKDEYIRFTFKDRELLKGKWIRLKENPIWETMIIFINDKEVGVDNAMYYSYEELLERFEFSDGKPCGKLG